jgi:hypothetical protein
VGFILAFRHYFITLGNMIRRMTQSMDKTNAETQNSNEKIMDEETLIKYMYLKTEPKCLQKTKTSHSRPYVQYTHIWFYRQQHIHIQTTSWTIREWRHNFIITYIMCSGFSFHSEQPKLGAAPASDDDEKSAHTREKRFTKREDRNIGRKTSATENDR